MSKYITGFCGIGSHEGSNPKNFKGSPLPTCTLWQDCSCSCHASYTEMFRLANMPRQPVNNSTYAAPEHSFYMPTLTERVAETLSNDRTVIASRTIESPDPAHVPPTVARSFADTPTGRSARGELEAQVDIVCKQWAVDHDPELCTPTWVSSEIAHQQGIMNPSVGAIQAVWDRWIKVGYATYAKKPVRFIGFTEDGIKLGLEACKLRNKLARSKVSR